MKSDELMPGYRHDPGTAPGTVVSAEDVLPTHVDVIAWSKDELIAEGRVTTERVRDVCGMGLPMVWVNIEGLADIAVLQELADQFSIHPLVMEDITSGHQRPKTEQWGEHRFFVARMTEVLSGHLTEQVSLFFGPGFLLSFQEGLEGDSFDLVRKRIHAGRDQLRSLGSDYLAYAIIDAVIDGYFPVLEDYGERLEAVEEEILLTPRPESVRSVHQIKRELLVLRRAIWPLREAVNALLRDEGDVISEVTRRHLLDAYDHVVQVIDLLETFRELGSGLVDLYLSSVSNRLNDIMKVLTIISVIFMPLTFVAGVYGMNFQDMPELRWHFGYFGALAIMATIAIVQITYFRHKGWLGGGDQ